MAYGGIVPREHSSGGSVRRGAITKTGNARLRRVLVEAAWHYRHTPTPGWTVKQRRRGQPGAICRIADKAQQRPHLRYRRLLSRGKASKPSSPHSDGSCSASCGRSPASSSANPLSPQPPRLPGERWPIGQSSSAARKGASSDLLADQRPCWIRVLKCEIAPDGS